jgi:hypothetical protein
VCGRPFFARAFTLTYRLEGKQPMTGKAVTRKQYAEHRGCAPSYVTALGKQGRLVLDAQGRVLVAETDALIANTGGDRPDVSARHATGRTQSAAKAQTDAGQGMESTPPEKTPPRPAAAFAGEQIGNSMAASRAVKEKYAALTAKIDYETKMRALVPREDVDAAMRFIGAAVRAAFDVLPDQTAPLVGPITDLAEIHEALTEACRNALHNIGTTIARQQAEITKEPA